MPRGYVPKGNSLGRFLGDTGQQISDLYRSAADSYNATVRSVQHYFANEPFENQRDFEIQSFLYQAGIPRDVSDDLLSYMDRNGLTWSDLNTEKTLQLYGSKTNAYKSFMFVSRNLNKLYK